MLERMIGVLRLDAHVFEEIERDPEATNQAFMVVILAGLAGGIGNIREDASSITAATTSQLGGWSLYAFLAWIIGSRLFSTPETSASWSEVARPLGFAYTPMLLSAFGVVPVPTLGDVTAVIGVAWFTIAAIVALRQALDFTTARAVGTGAVCLIALVVFQLAIYGLLQTP